MHTPRPRMFSFAIRRVCAMNAELARMVAVFGAVHIAHRATVLICARGCAGLALTIAALPGLRMTNKMTKIIKA
jgi:hypothetical protein